VTSVTVQYHGMGKVSLSALEVIFCNEMRYVNLCFTYLLTYLNDKFVIKT